MLVDMPEGIRKASQDVGAVNKKTDAVLHLLRGEKLTRRLMSCT